MTNATGQQLKQTFNPVTFVKDHGEAALQQELERRTDDDLRSILRFQGLRKGKELKKLERAEMLREIANGALAKLKQGMVVARMGATEVPEPQPADPTGVGGGPVESGEGGGR